jgi:hypothetical protein
MARLITSFVALPLVALLLLAGFVALLAEPGRRLQAIFDTRYQALWYLLLTYAALAVMATPLVILALRKGWLSWWHALLAGSLVGTLTFAPLYFAQLFDAKLHLHYRVGKLLELGEPAAIGAVHGLLFWALALWHNASVRKPQQDRRSAA